MCVCVCVHSLSFPESLWVSVNQPLSSSLSCLWPQLSLLLHLHHPFILSVLLLLPGRGSAALCDLSERTRIRTDGPG